MLDLAKEMKNLEVRMLWPSFLMLTCDDIPKRYRSISQSVKLEYHLIFLGMTMTEMVLATLVYSPLNHMTRLLVREYLIEFSHRENFKLYIIESYSRL
jgi:hypothetical protein